jgi:flagellar motility protein MotE (MotC chaperone)
MKGSPAGIVRLLTVIFAAVGVVMLLGMAVTWAMGWVSEAQMGDIMAILKGRTARTETAQGVGGDLGLPREQEALEKVIKAREAQEELSKKLELETARKQAELEGVRLDAQRALAELDAKSKRVNEEAKKFEAEKKAYQEGLAADGVKKLKEVLEEMEAAKAAEMLYEYDINMTVKVLGAVRKDERAAILEAIMDMDKKRGLTSTTGRAGQIIKMMGTPTATASAN